MSFPADELLLSCSIRHPASSLRATLEALSGTDLLTSGVDLGKLLRNMIIHSEHAKSELYHPAPELIAVGGDAIGTCDMRSLLLNAAAIESDLKHDELTEMHVLLATLRYQPSSVAAALRPLVAEYRRELPKGTKRRQMMLDFALDQGRADWITEARHAIEETPLSVERIQERVSAYLSSPYYPYGSLQWKAFQSEHPFYDKRSADGEPAETYRAYRSFLANGITGK